VGLGQPGERDDPVDHAVVGRAGTVTIRICGGDRPGEVRVTVRGTVEQFIAYADLPLEVGQAVLVYRSRGHRDVDVMPDPSGP
jgi:hypothetical protein